ncbi:MAG: urea carboxylase, partial [Verrucomicrobiota bacterium]
MFERVLIANRGVIANRIQRTLKRLGVSSAAVYAEADAYQKHIAEADAAISLGDGPVAGTYLDIDRIVDAARQTGSDAIHPGYGFLSESSVFAKACEEQGIAFLGPTPKQLHDFGLKHTSRELAEEVGIPLCPGTDLLTDADEALDAARAIGFPLMIKSTAGGGGIGMKVCHDIASLTELFEQTQRLAEANFSRGGIFIEKFVTHARHIEVQIFGDGEGKALSLGERDCSTQRRNQKVVEETPAPNLPEATRKELAERSERMAAAAHYRSAGTIEYLLDQTSGDFYFLEVNARLQVEHAVTEEVHGIDLIEWMVRLAAGELPDLDQLRTSPRGHSIQCRIYAENPARSYQPSCGVITHVSFPDDVRIESWIERGSEVTPLYDPMLSKLIVRGEDRPAALEKMGEALKQTAIYGVETNLEQLRHWMQSEAFTHGTTTTASLGGFTYTPQSVDVIEGGTQTTVQDWPGRIGYWSIGVPPSGPMDSLNFRLGNRLLGNPEGAPGIECTVMGPTLRFNTSLTICLTGADMQARLDDQSLPRYQTVKIKPGQTLSMGLVDGPGQRAYLLVQGGVLVPDYLDSRSTFTLGQFGGHAGRALEAGDVLHVAPTGKDVPARSIGGPPLTQAWRIGVIYGPHGAPDFFTPGDIEMFFNTDWKVHYNSDRTGVRLIGPRPEWARPDGGEAGLHPSNLHDNAYAIGTIDFTGDMPIILGPDGPSLGGFVCPATIVHADLWKTGQLKPGDTIRFVRLTHDEAEALDRRIEASIETQEPWPDVPANESLQIPETTLLRQNEDHPVGVTYRPSGDRYLLVEYGPMKLDLVLRFRVHSLMQRLEEENNDAIIDITPGIRSLQIHFDHRRLPLQQLLDHLQNIEHDLPELSDIEIPARVVHLPLSWDDPETRKAIDKYTRTVRPDAPWCPSNIEFIRRINGLPDIEAVQQIVFDASYLVLGLGDVYLGAPVATPIDPRHRLVTTKYNPARTWTPENAVGIGGAYLCIYGMEGPGGYQFVGRTLQMWNRYRESAAFAPGKPWLLEFFDQIRFYPVSAAELQTMRNDFQHGRLEIDIESTTFNLADYLAFRDREADSIKAFKDTQQRAFEEERDRWVQQGLATFAEEPDTPDQDDAAFSVPEGCQSLRSPVAGSVWKLLV